MNPLTRRGFLATGGSALALPLLFSSCRPEPEKAPGLAPVAPAAVSSGRADGVKTGGSRNV